MLFARIAVIAAGLVTGLAVAELSAHLLLPSPRPNRLPFLEFETDPHAGYRHKPGIGYTLGEKASINQAGFRGPEWTIEKKRGVRRIAVLGDSFVFGQGVGDGENLSAALEKKLNAQGGSFEVLNFGAEGYDVRHSMKVLEHHALKFRPDVVILHFHLHNIDFTEDYSFYAELFEKNRKSFSAEKWKLKEIARKSHVIMSLWDLMKARKPNPVFEAYLSSSAVAPDGPGKRGWTFISQQLRELKSLSEKHDFLPVLIVIPETPEIVTAGKGEAYVGFLGNQAESLGIPFLAMHEVLCGDAARSRELLIPYDNHLTAYGVSAVAEQEALLVLKHQGKKR